MNYVIIAAAGSGKRMKAKKNKVFLEIGKIPAICRTTLVFEKSKKIDGVVLVTRKGDIKNLNKLAQKYNFRKIIGIISGGKERQDSVFEGLKFLKNNGAKKSDIVLVHNGANPFIDKKLINNIIGAIKKHGAAICGFKTRDTIKEIKNHFVVQTMDRDYLWQIQTPQGARFADLFQVYQRAHQDGFFGTDDAMLLERAGHKIKMVACESKNIKITYPEDLISVKNEFKIGLGQDSHRVNLKSKIPNLKSHRPLVLAGVLVDETLTCEANSDGDVIAHALVNALSSAVGGRSISFYADKMCKQGVIDSFEYIKEVLRKEIKPRGFQINNVSIAMEAARPKLEKWHNKMKENLARVLKIKTDQIGLTFTSGEKLTAFGKGEGIQVFCVVSLIK